MFCACLDPIGAFIRVVSELPPRHAQTNQKGFQSLSLTRCVAVFGPSLSRTPIAIRMQTSNQVKQVTRILLEDIHTDTQTRIFHDTTRTTTIGCCEAGGQLWHRRVWLETSFESFLWLVVAPVC